MNIHTAMIDQHLGIDHDSQADEMKLVLTKALTALRMARPSNQRSAQQIAAARAAITRELRRAA